MKKMMRFIPFVTLAASVTLAATPAKDPYALTFTTPSVTAGQKLAQTCASCHGATGISKATNIPSLAGQTQPYLRAQLVNFRAKLRPSQVMQPIAAQLSDQQIVDLAAYFNAQKLGTAWKADAAARKRGEVLYTKGDPKQNVIACAVCHGADGRGLASHEIASVTNLPPQYAYAVLKEFHDAPSFGGVVTAETMRIAVKPLTDANMRDLAAYLSSMK